MKKKNYKDLEKRYRKFMELYELGARDMVLQIIMMIAGIDTTHKCDCGSNFIDPSHIQEELQRLVSYSRKELQRLR